MQALVFITGASSGIGQALALKFYQDGYRLALVARNSSAMQAWAGATRIDADRCAIYQADVTDTQRLIAIAEECIRNQGLPEIVIANAGISIGMDTAIQSDLDVMTRIYAVNNVGLAATFHPFLGGMLQRGSGTLVGMGSVAGIRGLPGHAAYCSSKAAVISYCESLRGELRGSGVRVVTICPGYIDTPLNRKNRYPMPFLMPADVFARKAKKVILAGTSYAVIPWQMGAVAKLMRLLPNPLFDRIFEGRPRKHREDAT